MNQAHLSGTADARSSAKFGLVHAAWLVLFLNSASALAFILVVEQPVFDDPNHLPDVDRYAKEPINSESIQHHLNPTGPGSFLWMALVGRMLGGGLGGYRLAVLACWALFGVWLLRESRRENNETPFSGTLLATLTFPHAATAMATMLTEGPALALACTGALVWSRARTRWTLVALGGFLIGLSVLCRQYYLGLLAAVPVAVLPAWLRGERDSAWRRAALGVACGALPIAWLLLQWGGFSSPAMVSGSSYHGVTSRLALSVYRPLAALFYVAVYMAPFGWPNTLRLGGGYRVVASVIAGLAACVVAASGWDWLGSGPIRSTIGALDVRTGLGTPILAAAAALAGYSFIGFLAKLRRRYADLGDELWLACSFLVCFVGEQLAIGGGIPFYERYMLQVMPFVGLLSWSLWPGTSKPRAAFCVLLWCMGQLMLWRYQS